MNSELPILLSAATKQSLWDWFKTTKEYFQLKNDIGEHMITWDQVATAALKRLYA
jgi:hypothetical protein